MNTAVAARANRLMRDDALYDIPAFGNVHLLHFTDCHAQLLPIHYREPSINLGVGSARGKVPHLVGMSLFAHLATLIKRLKGSRLKALLLDGGDTCQGSATALWTAGQDMVAASLALGVDVMTGHWGVHSRCRARDACRAQRLQEPHRFRGAKHRRESRRRSGLRTLRFPRTKRHIDSDSRPGVSLYAASQRCAVHTNWAFGIDEARLQALVEMVRGNGAQVVVLLSHNGMDIDLKLASRIYGIDIILGGHTHDGVPVPSVIANPGGSTIVTNAGSHGKFLAVVDFHVKHGRVADWRYHLLPVFSDLLLADATMQVTIDRVRAPFAARLHEPISESRELRYRRGNFNGSWDQLIVEALMQVADAEIVFSPGFRWGTSLLPGQMITREDPMAQTAITYPDTSLAYMTGADIRKTLEQLSDKLFNDDPYQHQGGDMLRTGGLTCTCEPGAGIGERISDMRLNGRLVDACKSYKVARWGVGASPCSTPARGTRRRALQLTSRHRTLSARSSPTSRASTGDPYERIALPPAGNGPRLLRDRRR